MTTTLTLTRLRNGVIGDAGDVRTLELGGVTDLDGVVTVHGQWRREDGIVIEVEGSVSDPQARLVSIDFGSFLTDAECAVGEWTFRTVIDKAEPSRLTFPQHEPQYITVSDEYTVTP